MTLLKRLFCQHGWEPQGWDSVVCRKCGKVTNNPALNHSLSRTARYSPAVYELLDAETGVDPGTVKPAPCD